MLRPLIRLSLPVAAILLGLAGPAVARAQSDPQGFHLTSSALFVHENAGRAVITVQRTKTQRASQIGYIALSQGHRCGSAQCSALYGLDFTSVKGLLHFPAGVASETFSVPIVDDHAATLPRTIVLSLFAGYPDGIATPSIAVLTILNDDPLAASEPLRPPSIHSNPLLGDRFYVYPTSDAALAARQHPLLNLIANQPWVERFGTFSGPDIGMAASYYLTRAASEAPGAVPMLSTYRLVNGHCGHYADPPAAQRSYRNFIGRFAQGIGTFRGVLFLEIDSLITVGCLSPHGVQVRMAELKDAVNILTAHCPRLVIYLDAGAGDAVPAHVTARLLRRAGVAKIQGFFINSTHFDRTSREIRYGETISKLTGGKHFVVSTSDNGRGPLRPRDPVHQGLEVVCNPRGRGLGPRPTANTGYAKVDAFAWILHPGESNGRCGAGAPPNGAYWPAYGEMLVRNAVFTVH